MRLEPAAVRAAALLACCLPAAFTLHEQQHEYALMCRSGHVRHHRSARNQEHVWTQTPEVIMNGRSASA